MNGQEIDCVAATEEVTHLVMCTVSRKLDKFRHDVDKLTKAGRFLAQHGDTVKLWEVTLDEPTADQRELAKKHAVTALSIAEFRRALIHADQYFELRKHYRFGSAIDPVCRHRFVSNRLNRLLTKRPADHQRRAADSRVRVVGMDRFNLADRCPATDDPTRTRVTIPGPADRPLRRAI